MTAPVTYKIGEYAVLDGVTLVIVYDCDPTHSYLISLAKTTPELFEHRVWINHDQLTKIAFQPGDKASTSLTVGPVTVGLYDPIHNTYQIMDPAGTWFLAKASELAPLGEGPADPRPQDDPTPAHDPVKHPKHYVAGRIETIDVLHDIAERLTKAGLPPAAVYDFTTAMKYVSRAGAKGDALEDIEKALWYIRFGLHQMAPEKHPDPRSDR